MRVLGVLSAFWCLRVMNVPTLQCIVPNRPWARRSTRDPSCQGHGTVAWQSGFCISHSLRETTSTENKSTAGRSGAPPALLAGICLNEPSY